MNLEAALFGNILGVTARAAVGARRRGLVTLALILLRYRQLLFATFDPEAADAYGVSSRGADRRLFAVIIAATVVATMQILGVTLIAATIVIPAVVARLLTDSFARDARHLDADRRGVRERCGMYVSFYVDTPPGGATSC